MKHLLVVFALLSFVPAVLSAQEKELVVSYKFERLSLSLRSLDHNDIQKGKLGPYSLNTYSYGNVSIRETRPRVFGGFNHEPRDTTFTYVKIDYNEAIILQPVVQKFVPGVGTELSMLLKEPLKLFKWELGKDTKTILGYQCNKATCNFRGRDYVAYFTRDIPFKAAPWKFHGLPGVVLEVYSTDEFCKWTAIALKIKPHEKEIELSHTGLPFINLDQYIIELKNKRLELIDIYKKNMLRFPQDMESHKVELEELKINLPRSIEIFDLE